MPDYIPNYIVDIILVLGECNYQQAAESYRDCFPNRQHPNDRIITRLVLCQRQGPVKKRRRINISESDDPQVVAVLAMAAINPYVTTRQIQRKLDISKPTEYW